MTISTSITQIHKCPECGFRTTLGTRYKRVGKKMVKEGKFRHCMHIDCDWQQDKLEQIFSPQPPKLV